MHPSDLAGVLRFVDQGCDEEGAAQELARVLKLDSDAEEALGRVIREAYRKGYHTAEARFRRRA